ncbi:MAG: SPOR domain-containing protein, partial [Hyphomicrobium sp.]
DAQGGHNDMGFAQPAGGELDQQYTDEDGQDYEVEETSRSKRPMMIAAALVGAILVGGGMSYGYKAFLGGGTSGTPPTVKSASAPSKIKPADAGGKQFAHTDSKIMTRLGEGAPAAGAADAASGELDANGTRKVSTLVVGRDGSIQAPAAAPAETPIATAPIATAPIATAPPPTSVSVPGMMVVDAMGSKNKTVAAAVAAGSAELEPAAAPAAAAKKLVVTPPAAPQKAVKVAAAETQRALPEATGSIEAPAAPAPVKKPALKKIAAATPATANDAYSAAPAGAPAAATGGASGYVAVLASVPKSASSQGDALKRYADMQQKYGGLLAGKTPSVAEANLGAKGAYHRLVVGPPASREQASTLCTQLKAQGYADCWVTSY